MRTNNLALTIPTCVFLALGVIAFTGCSREAKPTFKKIASGSQYAGHLSDYSKLAPNAKLEGNAVSYAKADAAKNLRKYVAVIVEPVEVYLATDVDEKNIPDRGRTALAQYFLAALTAAVSDAFPVVTEPGPLVLRLRTAIVGIDAGPAVSSSNGLANAEERLERTINIAKVAVEMELVDSESGEPNHRTLAWRL